VNDSLPAELLRQYVEQHIDEVVRRYRRDIRAWDVVNEAIDDNAGMRDTVFLRKLGPGYIADAFRRAHRADRDADLYYNDYNIEDINPKSDAVYELVSSLLAEGAPIHGIGVQGHIEGPAAPTYEGMKANFQRFADLGLTVNISELDVRIARLPGDLQTRLAVQKQIYHRIVAACVQVSGCVGITTWGFTDRHSWVDGVFGPDDPLPYDDFYRRKPAYYAIADGFMGVPPDPPGTAPNLVANSAFEIGGDGWTASSGALDTTEARAHTGASSARVKARAAESDGPAHDLRALVTPGRGYDVSVWTRISARSGAVRLVATTRCAGGPELVATLDSDVAGNRGWVELTGELLAPGCALDQLAIRVDGPAAGVTLYIDDVAVRPQPGDFGPNLIANPDFESGTTGWFGFGGPTLAASMAEAHGGAQSGFVSNRTGSFQGPGTSLLGLAFSNGTYRASAWARLSGAESGPAILTLKASCAGADQFIRIATGTATSTAWTEVSGTFTVPDCALTELTMYLEGPPAGVDQYVDDVSVRQDLSELEPNIIANPGFESGTASWFGFGGPTLAAQATQAHSGALSVLVTNRTASFQGPGQSLLAAATAGSYAASGWVRLANLAAAPIQMTLKTSCDGVDQFAAIGSANATDAGWTRIAGTLDVASCTLTDLVLYFEGPAAGVEFFVDDVTVRKLPSPELATPRVWPAR
jgi:endo-1,4-beta-xylanase